MNILSIRLRSIGRKMRLNHLVYHIRAALKPNRGYEEHLHRALERTVRPGDIVWDVGANVGVYTELFCKWVGPEGKVVAFEPNPDPIAQIKNRLPHCAWLTLENVALGSRDEESMLVVDGNNTVGGHVQIDSEAIRSGKSVIPIQVNTADGVCARIGKSPNVVKIDVEGFEEEVLLGFERTLSSPSLRAVLIEIHFQQLESRGQATAPIRIEKFLKHKGFRLEWVDSSHLLAERQLYSGTSRG